MGALFLFGILGMFYFGVFIIAIFIAIGSLISGGNPVGSIFGGIGTVLVLYGVFGILTYQYDGIGLLIFGIVMIVTSVATRFTKDMPYGERNIAHVMFAWLYNDIKERFSSLMDFS